MKLKPVKATDSSYKGLTVEVNGVKKEFDWSFPTLYEGKEHEFRYESPYPDLDQDRLGFGGVVYYHVEKQKLTSTLAQASE
ncbi:hypothetical protein EHV15_07120 [Paenibacillus oralis]|uniref:Uncharacterized protein n=1 Tax=Paenibacillus oralis TaxID=2490856 RepID=A0A3P3TY71_9BACL|nr:hypothetical protein [Paenibacillus oralis]RRJ62734.1 hypothetical protein EHV15_07120 [Paenibacillus oralis]